MRNQLIFSPENGPSLRTKLWWLSWDNYQTPLPTKGLLAGGAVASLILSEAWGGEFPINDLDVFSIISNNKDELHTTPVRISKIALDGQADEKDEYLGWYGVRNSGYQVIGSDRSNLINRVNVRMLEDDLPALTAYKHILKGFDLNCCQVGIDLENDHLIWTEDFAEFVATGQLKVTHLATPYHTAIRLAKKQAELGCYCDLKTELSLVATYVDMVAALGRSNKCNVMFSRYFGKEYLDTFYRYQEALDPFCQVYPGSSQLTLPGFDCVDTEYYRMSLNVPSRYLDLMPFFIKSGLQLNSVSMIQMFDKLCRPTTSAVTRRKFATAILSGKLSPICAIQNSTFLNGNHHPNHLRKLEKFADKHFGIVCQFNRLGLNAAEQLKAIQTIWRATQKHGLFVIGLLEDNDNEILRDIKYYSEELIEQLIESFTESWTGDPLVEPLNLSGFYRKHQVLELVTAQQLMEESHKQNNCVGGYADIILAEKCRIFHLEHRGESTTLKISQNGKCDEHRARFNKLPSQEHITLAFELSDYIRTHNSGVDPFEPGLLDTMPNCNI